MYFILIVYYYTWISIWYNVRQQIGLLSRPLDDRTEWSKNGL